jgi:hypothetical protein
MEWHPHCDFSAKATLAGLPMKRLPQARQPIRLLCALLAMTLVWSTGCTRQLAASGVSEDAKSGQLPFDRVADGGGLSPTNGFDPNDIPAGTRLNIRLQGPLSSASVRIGESFSAVLDEPVLVGGKMVMPLGTPVTGTVIASKASRQLNDPGYLRLKLSSMVVNGKSISLRTSSVFAKGGSYLSTPTIHGTALNSGDSSLNPSRGDVRFSTGHRLTFRLAQSLRPQS